MLSELVLTCSVRSVEFTDDSWGQWGSWGACGLWDKRNQRPADSGSPGGEAGSLARPPTRVGDPASRRVELTGGAARWRPITLAPPGRLT